MNASARTLLLATLVSPLGCSIYGADLFADGGGGSTGGGKPGSGGKTDASGGLGGGGAATGGTPSDGGSATGATNSGGVATGGGATTTELIDDFEDFNVTVRYADKRNGHWDVATDGTGGSITPTQGFSTPDDVSADPPYEGSNYGLHVQGSGFSTWGASLNVSLLASGAYDASKYSGVAFWAKAGTSAVKNVAVRLVSGDTDPRGGVCKETGMTSELCYDHFYTDVTLTTEWKYFEVPFAEFHQKSAGMQFPEIDIAEVYQFEFFFGQGQTFELWIDDFAFTLD